jgi:hypothetical protein
MIHINMEMKKENSLSSYLKQAKVPFFFFYRIRKQESGTGPALWRLVPVERGKRWEKGIGG